MVASTKKTTPNKTAAKTASTTAAETTKTTTTKSAPKTTEARLNDIEKRLAELESNKCDMTEKMQKCWKDCKVPSQQDVSNWVKANPFLALAVAVLATALIVSIIA